MQKTSDEQGLIQNAQAVLGDERVLAAGTFALQDLVYAQAAGLTAGGLLAESLPGAADAAASVAASRTAVKAAAAAQGVTVKLIVAVTDAHIYVMKWGPEPTNDRIVHTFGRATTAVKITKFGLSRVVHLEDSSTGEEVELHASVARWTRQSGPDKHVLELLAAA
ncbi:MAG: hypothetical protein JJE46_04705 [Acidimicrobiia bacterium]|nr:hypothetical protein [Acidimicrobiia bacterium]